MSETKAENTTAETAQTTAQDKASTQLADLMAEGQKAPAAKTKSKPDLDANALRAAETALAEGERAIAEARAQLGAEGDASRKQRRRGRELALRLLLAANVLAMLVVAMLPSPVTKTETPTAVHDAIPQKPTPPAPVAETPRTDDKYMQAMAAASKNDYAKATTLLQQYLDESPRMASSSKISALLALEYYAMRMGNLTASQEYRGRVQALESSHMLPKDLIEMAQAAAKSGDQESLRRVWARFLLQQRQVPSSLFKYVAEAYLQLGDSYRNQANAAAEQERVRALEETAARLRAEANGTEGGR